jgi:tRNA dimethylallyltransferase
MSFQLLATSRKITQSPQLMAHSFCNMKNLHYTAIIIVGPTASGKTALSLELAEYLKTSIISADSRQCFKELNIGVSKPTDEELHRIKHYFINSHSIFDNVTAQTFEQYALQSAREIFINNKHAVVAGGTGLYVQAFCEGLDPVPPADEKIREKIITNYNSYGLTWLQEELKEKDPVFWKTSEKKNPQRLIRALEVLYSTGKSITNFRTKKKEERPFDIIKIGLQIPKEQLHENINNRVDKMIQTGLIEEVESLLPYKNLNALQTVGYKEIFLFLEGKTSLQNAIEAIKYNTRQYAKRQVTWFKKDKSIYWIEAANIELILSLLK